MRRIKSGRFYIDQISSRTRNLQYDMQIHLSGIKQNQNNFQCKKNSRNISEPIRSLEEVKYKTRREHKYMKW